MFVLTQEQLKAVCDILAETSTGLTKSNLATVLGQSGIEAIDDGSRKNGIIYSIGLGSVDTIVTK